MKRRKYLENKGFLRDEGHKNPRESTTSDSLVHEDISMIALATTLVLSLSFHLGLFLYHCKLVEVVWNGFQEVTEVVFP
jgi:hypothetical protein